jgi:transposase-like protein
MSKQPKIHQLTVAQFEAQFPDDDACKSFLQAQRWPDGVCCPRCLNKAVHALPSKPFHWVCNNCSASRTNYRFSVLVDTIFENTNKGLRQWFRVIHLMLVSKKGMSALQIQRYMGFGSYKTAWGMCHKVRTALMDKEFQQLIGFVEVDETYVGGKNSNRHKDKRGGPGGTGGGSAPNGTAGKTAVIGAVQRKGNVVARVIASTDTLTLHSFVREAVSTKVSLISTDEHSGYRHLGREYAHGVVRHSAGEYVAGAVHTNTIEGFWSLIKRGVIGTYHKVSAKYLPLYVAEFQFRYNNRLNADIFGAAVAGC